MPTVRDVISRKGREVIMVGADCTVLEAARIMMRGRIGGVLVTDDDTRVVGIFTERDVLGRVVAEQLDPATTAVSEVMTPRPVSVSPLATLDDCSNLMTQRRVRHLPVMDCDELQGIITPGDLLAFRVAEQETLIQDLHSYVFDLR